MSLEFNGKTLVSGFQFNDDVSEEFTLTAFDFSACCQMEDLEESLNALFFVALLKKPEEAENPSS